MKVTVLPSGREFATDAGESVLAAALRAGLNLPHSCRGGSCGSCRARLVAGHYAYPRAVPPGLSADEAARGYLLLCQAQAGSDLLIETRELQPVADVRIRSLPCRVERLQRLAADVMGLWLRLPAVEPFTWQPGQYIDILLPGGRRRSFSIASPPQDPLLELHVRRVPGGAFSAQVFETLQRGALLRLEGPLGQFVYRESDRPLLFVGGGTGHAPLKALARHVLARDPARSIDWWWGVRTAADAYDEAWLEATAQVAEGLRHRLVQSAPPGRVTGPVGLVHAALLAAHADLAPFDIYVAGPPALVAAARDEFPRHGADPARLYFDSFDYASPAGDAA